MKDKYYKVTARHQNFFVHIHAFIRAHSQALAPTLGPKIVHDDWAHLVLYLRNPSAKLLETLHSIGAQVVPEAPPKC